ncbi:hypothetical protein Rsub_10832 [Raphidocelis subcapitata]|uniref:Uncharacterized protein n=2 Tax=Raphidocelis subcapitata TaxID=307507 RepID=A0A2V0PKU9_9CHLO|nr:hypothetical protein Rsub_10832 [Raphidocelis subcapitata]|eukprot:GBF98643.1 hypothetical protein Rsub_10832 [Raphidocelis subcapitata]
MSTGRQEAEVAAPRRGVFVFGVEQQGSSGDNQEGGAPAAAGRQQRQQRRQRQQRQQEQPVEPHGGGGQRRGRATARSPARGARGDGEAVPKVARLSERDRTQPPSPAPSAPTVAFTAAGRRVRAPGKWWSAAQAQ